MLYLHVIRTINCIILYNQSLIFTLSIKYIKVYSEIQYFLYDIEQRCIKAIDKQYCKPL